VTVYDRKNGAEHYSVYRHQDGYPDSEHGVLATLAQALSYAWPLPRFEADDFAAAIIAAWKKPGGGYIRMSEGRDAHDDTEWHYDIYPDPQKHRICVLTYEATKRLCSDRVWVQRRRFQYFLTAHQDQPVEV
jgi:hypothetical protein